MTLTRITAALLCAAMGASALAGCGGDKQVSSSDRDAFDQFASGVRQWKKDGAGPWLAAFKQGTAPLEAAAPQVEANMQKSINTMSSAANKISVPPVRSKMQSLVSTYRGKLNAVKSIDSAGYSPSAIADGLAQLKTEGTATLKAWKAYVAAAQKEWKTNPLSGLNLG